MIALNMLHSKPSYASRSTIFIAGLVFYFAAAMSFYAVSFEVSPTSSHFLSDIAYSMVIVALTISYPIAEFFVKDTIPKNDTLSSHILSAIAPAATLTTLVSFSMLFCIMLSLAVGNTSHPRELNPLTYVTLIFDYALHR